MKELSQAEIERRKKFGKVAVKHGMYKTPEHNAWLALRYRCSNSSHPCYHHYGGRGITVCEQWNDFSVFLADMGKRPTSKHSIERIDNSKGYSPENCRWAIQSEQMANTRRSIRFEFNGKVQCLKAHCRDIGQDYQVARRRISKDKWDFYEALTTPVISKYSKYNKVRNTQ